MIQLQGKWHVLVRFSLKSGYSHSTCCHTLTFYKTDYLLLSNLVTHVDTNPQWPVSMEHTLNFQPDHSAWAASSVRLSFFQLYSLCTPHATMLQCALEGLLGVKPQVRSYSTPVLTICHGGRSCRPAPARPLSLPSSAQTCVSLSVGLRRPSSAALIWSAAVNWWLSA